MRRPLFWVSACLVIFMVIRLRVGWPAVENQDCAEGGVYDGALLRVTGQVYKRDEESIYIKDVILEDFKGLSEPINSTESGVSTRLDISTESGVSTKSDISTESGVSTKSDISTESAAASQQPFSNLICELNTKNNSAGAGFYLEKIALGSRVELAGIFAPFSRAGNPGEFDAAVYYQSLGICGKLRETRVLAVGKEHWYIRERLSEWNGRLSKRLYMALPREYAAIMEAMLLGEQGNIEREIKDLYRRNGILHILSISGMHVSIIGMGIHKLLRRLGLPGKMSAICGGIFLLAYGALTGFGLSAVRAIGMFLVRMLGEVVGRTYDMLTTIGLVGCCMVCWNPNYLQNSGFLLSFSCVLGIGIIYPILLPEYQQYQGNNRPAITIAQKLGEYWRRAGLVQKAGEAFYLSLSVTLATLPVQLCVYYEVPVFSICLNLLIVPFVKPLMLSGIVTMAIPKNIVFEAAVCGIFKGYEFVCRCFDVLPVQTWNPGCPKVWQVVVYYSMLVGILWWKRQQKERQSLGEGDRDGKKRTVLCRNMLGVLLLGGAIAVLGVRGRRQSQVSFLDVGQGSCVLLQLTSGENYLFDCGSTSRSSVGQYVLLPYLKHEGIRTLDGVFVSHPDSDHVNGILELLEGREQNNIAIKQLLLPDVEKQTKTEDFDKLWRAVAGGERETSHVADGLEKWFGLRKQSRCGTEIRYLSRGDCLEGQGARFLCLHPGKNCDLKDANQYSQCIYVEFLEGKDTVATLLLTGDVCGSGEADLMRALKDYGKGKVTVLQCAHHGSGNANSEGLLEILQPRLTVISAARNNRYGHPHEETLDRLEAVKSAVFTTIDCGMVRVELGDRVRVYRFKR